MSAIGVDQREAGAACLGLPTSGPLSELVAAMLSTPAVENEVPPLEATEGVGRLLAEVDDPATDDDLQLALYLCYELHYRSFPDVDPAWEWNPTLLAACAALEAPFLAALREAAGEGEAVDPSGVGDRLSRFEESDQGVSLSRYLEQQAGFDQFREFVVHHSLYQLKEADPHSWAIPRLAGAAKAALLEVQADQYGGGRPERMHSALFAKTMRALGLDDRENAYLAQVPGTTLATVNAISAFGLHHARRGALVGHLAMFEMASARPNRRYGNALRRLGCDAEATDFYDEHVEADAVHESIAASDLAGGLAQAERKVAEDVVFGARAMLQLEDRFARRLLVAWNRGESSLRL